MSLSTHPQPETAPHPGLLSAAPAVPVPGDSYTLTHRPRRTSTALPSPGRLGEALAQPGGTPGRSPCPSPAGKGTGGSMPPRLAHSAGLGRLNPPQVPSESLGEPVLTHPPFSWVKGELPVYRRVILPPAFSSASPKIPQIYRSDVVQGTRKGQRAEPVWGASGAP